VLGACSAREPDANTLEQPIRGGDAVRAGAWPNVAWLDNGCTSTLLAPDLLVFAAHCGDGAQIAYFSDELELAIDPINRTARAIPSEGLVSVSVARCETYPDWSFGAGNDIAYCVLERPVVGDGSIAPPLTGCARDLLREGMLATLVGFGEDVPDSGAGRKRSVEVPIARLAPELPLGDEERGTCSGDSGGPALVALGDSAHPDWRVAGVLSSGLSGEGCGVGYYTDVSAFVDWLEASSQRTLAPCSAKSASSTARCLGAALDRYGVPTPKAAAPLTACSSSKDAEANCAFGAPSGSRASAGAALLAVAAVFILRRRPHHRR